MNKPLNTQLHEALDGTEQPPAEREPLEHLRQYQESLDLLKQSRVGAPPELADRVLRALSQPRATPSGAAWREWLPSPRQWLAPALTGAVAAALLMFGWFRASPSPPASAGRLIAVRFELHAPGARQVEVLGNFNQWQRGTALLRGPDASGHWMTDLDLPAGRYEYLFLVDGKDWVADPVATVLRADGFGRYNAILEISSEGDRL